MAMTVSDALLKYSHFVKESRSQWDFAETSGSRLNYALLIPLSFVLNTLDTLGGIFAGIANVATGGSYPSLKNYTVNNLKGAESLFAQPFQFLIATMRPDAVLKGENKKDSIDNTGFFAAVADGFLIGVALSCQQSKNKVISQGVSRLAHSARLLVAIITRAVDLAIGAIASFFALLTTGYFDELNRVAFRGLQSTALLSDIFLIAKEIINPSDDIKYQEYWD